MIATGEGTTQWNQVMAAMLLTLIRRSSSF
jgi:hypothetical protein